MSVDSFFTLQNLMPGATRPDTQASANANALAELPERDGTNFVDMILNYMKEIGEAKDEQLKEEKEELLLAKMLADNPDVAEQIEDMSLDEVSDLAAALALNQQAFDEIMKPIEVETTISTDIVETPAGTVEITKSLFVDTEKNHRPILSEIKTIAEKLQTLAEEGSPQLSAADLTPQEITAIQDYLTALKNGEIPEDTPEVGLLAGLIKLMPPAASADVVVTAQGVIAPRSFGASGNIEGKVGNLTTDADIDTGDFEAAVKDLTKGYRSNEAAQGAPKAPLPTPTHVVHSNAGFNLEGALVALIDPDSPLAAQYGLGTASSNPSAPANLANPVMLSYSAGTTHPATKMVANALQKFAQSGQDADITLRLDPPDLGRVQARLQFGKDKALRTTVMVEKPETFAMLQRDMHSLERALQDVGLDMSDGISMELAEQGFNFDQNGNERGGGHDAGGTGASAQAGGEDDLAIIETTMTWHVDPQTGHTSYDIWA